MGKGKYRMVICPCCGKHFDPRQEGFNLNNRLVCADCYNNATYRTHKDFVNDRKR